MKISPPHNLLCAASLGGFLSFGTDVSAVVVLDETFDNATGFTSSELFFSDEAVSTGSDFFGISDGAGGGDFGGADPASTNVQEYTGFTGNFLTGMDLDGEGITPPIVVDWTGLSITGLTGLVFSGDFAEFFDAPGNIDNGDFLRIEAQVDSGGYVNILEFRGNGAPFNGLFAIDTDLNGVGDGMTLGTAAQNISAGISGTGTTLDLRLSLSVDAVGEDFGIDNFQVSGVPEPGSAALFALGSLCLLRRCRR